MRLVGLTGRIACGKSTVSARFQGVHGFPVVDADRVARDIVEPGSPALSEIAEYFGREYLTPEGTLDRPKLGALVFADEQARIALNGITHPRITQEIARRVSEHADFDGPVLVDSALLVEMGQAPLYPSIVVVACSPEVQLARLMGDRGMDEQLARDRIQSQGSQEDKLAVATHVIWNDGDLADLEQRVDEVAAVL